MNNLFLRLYLLIVSTVIIVGLSLDFAWQYFEQSKSSNINHQILLNIVSIQLKNLSIEEQAIHLQLINRQLDGEFSILSGDDKLAISLSEELINDPLFSMESDSEILSFKLIDSNSQILQFKQKKNTEAHLSKNLFIALFYGLIALMIFYWIWPLSKDLNRLEKAVNQFDQQQWQSKVELPITSSINHLARAYNSLLDKIKLLIENQQAMSHSISHELRTPLARIRFSLQMAEESDDITIVKNQIGSIKDDISEMNELINDLLNFASLESISTVAKLEKGDINTLIETLIGRLAKNYPDKNIEFVKNPTDPTVLCDSYLIERAIQNLIVNACKFSNKNILITFQELEQNYNILVEDDGVGVVKEARTEIFDSFFQLDNKLDNQQKNKGFGLGLAIVKRTMTLHQGDAKVENSSLGGAKFVLSWPKATENLIK